jgi:hypothetical protein
VISIGSSFNFGSLKKRALMESAIAVSFGLREQPTKPTQIQIDRIAMVSFVLILVSL